MQVSRGAMPGVDEHVRRLKPAGVALAWPTSERAHTWGSPKPLRPGPRVFDGRSAQQVVLLLHYACLPFFLTFLWPSLRLATLLLPCLPPLLTGRVFHTR